MQQFDSFLSSISQRQKNPEVKQLKFISPAKWQKSMIDCLKDIADKNPQKKKLAADLITIIELIPQTNFVQASLKIRPFRPQFLQTMPILTNVTQSTLAETIVKHVKYQQFKLKYKMEVQKRYKITQKTLLQQFDKDYHPFKFIIKNFQRLLELKYKSVLDSGKIQTFQVLFKQLKSDMDLFSQLITKSSQPYKKLFKINTPTIKDRQINKFRQFLQSFIFDNQKINKCIHKIIVYATKIFYQQKLQEKIKDKPYYQDFNLPKQYQIDSSYIRTINSFIQFAQLTHHQKCLKKLVEIRQNILLDIDQHCTNSKIQKQLRVCAEVQIQIIRFCIAKLKVWSCQLFAQVKYLQYVYGSQQICFKFQESSYIYTQICMAFQSLQIEE